MLHPVPLEALAYAPYGDVVSVRADVRVTDANFGTARRYHHLASLRDLRPGHARPNVCVYRCQPAPPGPVWVRALERHAHSTQLFIPMGSHARYLVVVALGGDRPDLATLRVFLAGASQGITYHPGVWHHPMVVLDAPTDMSCVVFEDDTEGDCELVSLEPARSIAVPPA